MKPEKFDFHFRKYIHQQLSSLRFGINRLRTKLQTYLDIYFPETEPIDRSFQSRTVTSRVQMTLVITISILKHIKCLHILYAEAAKWFGLVSYIVFRDHDTESCDVIMVKAFSSSYASLPPRKVCLGIEVIYGPSSKHNTLFQLFTIDA